MKLASVWVVEGRAGDPGGSLAAFGLQVEPAGWTLIDAEEPTVERVWPWEAIGGLEVVRGAGRTPDGRPATLLELIVNGWPVRVVVPTEELPAQTIAMLGAFAPFGHPLRAHVRVKRAPPSRRLSTASLAFMGSRLRAGKESLSSLSTTRARAAVIAGLVLVATVIAASIAGVATSAQSPGTVHGHSATQSNDPAAGAPSSSQAQGITSGPTTTPPAVAASGGSGTGATPALATTSTTKPSSTKKTTTKKTTATTKATTTTKPAVATSPASSPTTPAPAPTTPAPAPTTPAPAPTTPAPTTTTTRAPRPPTTTTVPVTTTTTRTTRPGRSTTTTAATTRVVVSIPVLSIP